MSSSRKPRRYDASRRRQQAESTKSAILTAARRLFAEHGYAATTLTRVAEEAAVSVQTVYAIFRSKRAILSALVESMDAAADVPALAREVLAAADPRAQLQGAVGISARVFSGGYDVIEILRGAGTADPDLAHVWREGEARRRRPQAQLTRHWADTGALRPGLAAREATDVLWAMTGPDVYRLFVIESRWATARYQRWLTEFLARALFAETSS
jgi:AcrR family transcriptional regulator